MAIGNNAYYDDVGALTLRERVDDLTNFGATDNDFVNHMLAEGATDVLMKVKKMNPVDFKLFTLSFSSKLSTISTGGNLYYPTNHANKGDGDWQNNHIFHPTGNNDMTSKVLYIEVKNDNPVDEPTIGVGTYLKFTTSTAFADYMSAFDGELVKVTTWEESADHSATAGYTLYKAGLIRGLNGDNTIIDTDTNMNILPLSTSVLRMDQTIDVQRLQEYEYNNSTLYRYRFCEEASSRDRYRLSDPDSFAFATSDRPAYYRENNQLTVVPSLNSNEDWVITVGATPSYVDIDCNTDKRLDNVPEKYEGAVIFYAALKVITRLYEDTIKNEEDAELGQGYAQLMQALQLQYISALQIPPTKEDKAVV